MLHQINGNKGRKNYNDDNMRFLGYHEMIFKIRKKSAFFKDIQLFGEG